MNRQLKIPLMTICSLEDSQPDIGQAQNIAGNSDVGILRSVSSAQNRPHHDLRTGPFHSHSRSTSLGDFITGKRHDNRAADGYDSDHHGSGTPERPSTPAKGESSNNQESSTDKPLPAPPGGEASQSARAKPTPVMLKPHIVSPTPEEFLLVTGTSPLDRGIGIFVNLDGDPTRPTLEFDRYPKEIVVDGGVSDMTSSRATLGEEDEGYVLASTTRDFEDGLHTGLEIQRWDLSSGQDIPRHWLEAPVKSSGESDSPKDPTILGIRALMGSEESSFQEVVDLLCQKRFSPFSAGDLETSTGSLKSVNSPTALSMERVSKERQLFERDDDESPLPEGWEAMRNEEEEEFAQRFAKTTSRLVVWSGNHIWWATRNPLILQLEARIGSAALGQREPSHTAEERLEIFNILSTIRGRDAKTELEFMTFNYIRQRASVLLFMSFLHSKETPFSEGELRAMEGVLLDGNLDARVILGLVPGLRNEIVETRKGIWIFSGVKSTIEWYMASERFGQIGQTINDLERGTLLFVKSYLTSLRRKKGLASTANESEMFRTVDASLLVVLLDLDQNSPKGMGKPGSIRFELYEIVDKGVDCFERAVDLLESCHRLYVLSRLYHNRKMVSDVLATWRRIIEGDLDDGGELQDGEQKVREYLSKISSQALVQEYGVWLATRNPKLGVQVFADDKGRAPKFEPAQVVAILREEAPDAVKYYLEYLVFGKGHTGYVNELITYYLDIVIQDLQSSPEARETVTASYEAYRALRPPKPTYRQFLTDNAPDDDEVWHSRLRLLQLLGEAHEYDAKEIRNRIAKALPADTADSPEKQLLVPEAIILNGRERRHEEALRLLVHRLGDYDTAVSYCLRGGASIYTPTPGRRGSMPTEDTQAGLFRTLLQEFLTLEDLNDRIEQTGALLERFGGWFDVMEILELIPDGWSVDIFAGFLVTALRRLVREKHETTIASKLSSAENLRVNYDLLVKIDEKGPTIKTGSSGEVI